MIEKQFTVFAERHEENKQKIKEKEEAERLAEQKKAQQAKELEEAAAASRIPKHATQIEPKHTNAPQMDQQKETPSVAKAKTSKTPDSIQSKKENEIVAHTDSGSSNSMLIMGVAAIAIAGLAFWKLSK